MNSFELSQSKHFEMYLFCLPTHTHTYTFMFWVCVRIKYLQLLAINLIVGVSFSPLLHMFARKFNRAGRKFQFPHVGHK